MAAAAVPAPEKAPVAGAGETVIVPVINRAASPAAPELRDEVVLAKTSLAQQASEILGQNWRWLWALLLLPLVAGVWVWRAHFSAYDKAGLPRGPRL